ncbi:T9SS sorting signal type C domain-containing protein [Moheibacter lacus]|uniref:T9SS sorting signal type C domain-containing protein n=1 Tax=Moheibacter lacus TaxID=2745851 RepID=A0A838ZL95_9FLAO|nr:T9SS sorting signal type C domain-containing protein [Moheibacter lacus]MBA5628286.1 T9SS sorting signal type C domain-containing protein [Moheibacter lacus]
MSSIGFAQISIIENFNSTTVNTLPDDWTVDDEDIYPFSTLNTPHSCDGKGLSDNVSSFSLNKTSYVQTPTDVSNGAIVNVSFDFKVVNNSFGPLSGNWGNLYFEYQVGTNPSWTIAQNINNSNYSSSNTCVNRNFTIPAINFPNGQNVRFRFRDVYGTAGTPDFIVIIDNVNITQTASNPPNCDANLTSPINGAINVPISTNQINWSFATGGATNYRISMGTTPGGSQIANNIDLGNVNTYTIPVQLLYATTYYVRIVPTNASGPATGCVEQSFTTIAPITISRPWEEPFQSSYSGPPINIYGWEVDDYIVSTMPSRFAVNPDNLNGYILHQQLNEPKNFQTISVGVIQAGDLLEFDYAFGPYDSGVIPGPSDAEIRIYISTDYGITYPSTPIAVLTPNSTNNWRDFSYDLSSYAGQFVKIKIETNPLLSRFSAGFDNFYIGHEITCERAENVELVYVGSTSAQATWDAVSGASSYDWMVFLDGDDPEIDVPVFTGNTNSTTITVNNLAPGTAYDFYVQTDCGVDGESFLSEVLNFTTRCSAIDDFPYIESFEDSSANRPCWQNEYVVPGSLPLNWRYMSQTDPYSIINTHDGVKYAFFQRDVKDGNTTKLVSIPLDLSGVSQPKLSFWYVNMYNEAPESLSINTLKVYYKTSPNGNWIQLGTTFDSDVTEWTNVEFNLPNPSSEYYIAFEGMNDWGLGIGIDSVEIYDDYTCPFETTWDGMAWSNELPDADTKAIINGDFVLTSDLTACQIEITALGSLEIPSNLTLNVVDRITNLATSEDFIVRNEANLIQERDVENIGEIRVHRIGIPYKRLDYTIWGSPVLGQELKAFSPMTVNNRIMTYNGTDGYQPVPDIYADFIPGQGVMFRAPNNWSSTTPAAYHGVFTGVPQNGTYSYPTYEDSYTSIGNPYPSNLDAYEFFIANPKVETLYFWTNLNPVENGSYSGNNYATLNLAGGTITPTSPDNGGENEKPNGIISVGQGFIVKTLDTEEVVFNNEMRTDSDAPFFKGEIERHRFWLNLTDQNDYGFNQILVTYMNGATEGIDTQMDAKMLNYNGPAIFNQILEQPFIIQSRPTPFDIHDRISLGFKSNRHDRFKIQLANFDGLFSQIDIKIYIKDLYDNSVHCLSDSEFEFEGYEGFELKRFEVFYLPESVNLQTDEFATNGIILYKSRAYIEILSEFQHIESVEVFDLSGRKLWSDQDLNAKKHRLLSANFGSQILLIQIKLENGEMVSKKWVN